MVSRSVEKGSREGVMEWGEFSLCTGHPGKIYQTIYLGKELNLLRG